MFIEIFLYIYIKFLIQELLEYSEKCRNSKNKKQCSTQVSNLIKDHVSFKEFEGQVMMAKRKQKVQAFTTFSEI